MADKEYYDEVNEEAYAQSAKNVSQPDPRSRDLYQSTTISTDDTGPTVDQVAPVFAQARADALANPVLPDGDLDDETAAANQESAAAAAAEAEAIRQSAGFVAPTGADAGIYDDAQLEKQVPSENYSPAPDAGDGQPAPVADAPADPGSVYTDDSQVGNSSTNGVQVSSDDKKDELAADQAHSFSDANPAPADQDTTHDDLVSDTSGEQGGIDATSAPKAAPKVSGKAKSQNAVNDQSNTEADAPKSTPEAPTSNA